MYFFRLFLEAKQFKNIYCSKDLINKSFKASNLSKLVPEKLIITKETLFKIKILKPPQDNFATILAKIYETNFSVSVKKF